MKELEQGSFRGVFLNQHRRQYADAQPSCGALCCYDDAPTFANLDNPHWLPDGARTVVVRRWSGWFVLPFDGDGSAGRRRVPTLPRAKGTSRGYQKRATIINELEHSRRCGLTYEAQPRLRQQTSAAAHC